MTIRTFGLLNLGRDKDPNRSTQRIDREMLEQLLEAVGDEQAAVFFVEINEGDDNDELALIRQVFKGWQVHAGTKARPVREPIALSPDQPEARSSVLWVPGTAVKHWSPQRSVLKVHLADEDHSLISCHNAAGPHTAGDRPDWAKGPLATSWQMSNLARIQTKRGLHKRGRNVTEMSDLNHYRLQALPGEVAVVHERTDYGYAYAADGYTAAFREGRSVNVRLDSHDIKTMHGTYRKETP